MNAPEKAAILSLVGVGFVIIGVLTDDTFFAIPAGLIALGAIIVLVKEFFNGFKMNPWLDYPRIFFGIMSLWVEDVFDTPGKRILFALLVTVFICTMLFLVIGQLQGWTK